MNDIKQNNVQLSSALTRCPAKSMNDSSTVFCESVICLDGGGDGTDRGIAGYAWALGRVAADWGRSNF